MSLDRLEVHWSGFAGAPGVSTFYATPGGDVREKVVNFFDGIKGVFPSVVKWTIPTVGDTIDEASGLVEDAWTVTGGDDIISGTISGAAFSSPAGAVVHWKTGGIVAGRHVRGRTFLVPIGAGQFDIDGTLAPSCVSTLQNQATLLVVDSAEHLMVWHRPPHGASSGGSAHKVIAATVPDRAAVLTSRRA